MGNKRSFLLIVINLIIVIACLILDYTMYISLVEFMLMVISFTLFVLFLETYKTKLKFLFKLIASVIYTILFILADLTIDHFTLPLFITVVEDGKRLTLLQTIREFKDDAFYLLFIFVVLYFIEFIILHIFSRLKFIRKLH
ncbi:MAG: hypothetical protein GX072_13330 [Lysinibacillus sp.]|jgi:hypothetical protein|nr:hypothetical protein [Lysinibacillus sp.]